VKTLAEISATNPSRIEVGVDYRLKDLVKAVPGARWNAAERTWTVPLSWPACLALRAEFGADLQIGPDLKDWATNTARSKKALLALRGTALTEEATLDELPGCAGLYRYQVNGAKAIFHGHSYLVMDETGTGKSRTALAGVSLLGCEYDVFPLLIVAPKSMLVTWSRETERFFPGKDIRVVAGTPKTKEKLLAPGGDVYIMTYDGLRKYSRISPFGSVVLKEDERVDKELQAIAPATIIADEVHRAKSPKAAQTRALWSVGRKATFRIGLTGTPMQDTPVDLWSILHFIAPTEYPSKSAYVDRYVEHGFNPWGGMEVKGLLPTTRDEFFANFDARSRRITKDMALPFLPPKVFEIRWVELPPKLRKAYQSMADTLMAELDGGTVAAQSVLERAGRLCQLASASGEMVTQPDGSTTYRMAAPSPKIDAFMEDVKAGDFDGQSVVVFSDSRQLIDLLGEALDKAKLQYVRVTGAETGEERQAAMDAFQDGAVQFILLTRAGGEGITLTKASVMVRLVRSWSLTVHRQVEDRVHRIGSEQHDSILIVDYISENTVEEGQLVRLNAKEARAQDVLRDKELLALMRGDDETGD